MKVEMSAFLPNEILGEIFIHIIFAANSDFCKILKHTYHEKVLEQIYKIYVSCVHKFILPLRLTSKRFNNVIDTISSQGKFACLLLNLPNKIIEIKEVDLGVICVSGGFRIRSIIEFAPDLFTYSCKNLPYVGDKISIIDTDVKVIDGYFCCNIIFADIIPPYLIKDKWASCNGYIYKIFLMFDSNQNLQTIEIRKWKDASPNIGYFVEVQNNIIWSYYNTQNRKDYVRLPECLNKNWHGKIRANLLDKLEDSFARQVNHVFEFIGV